MKKRILANAILAAIYGFGAAALANNNTTESTQSGSSNDVTASQSGTSNEVYNTQSGTNNSAEITQKVTTIYNTASNSQSGVDSYSKITQMNGADNEATVNQSGEEDSAQILQSGNSNSANISQANANKNRGKDEGKSEKSRGKSKSEGRRESAELGDQLAKISQSGNHNVATANQNSGVAEAYNTATLSQTGYGNYVNSSQDGVNNSVNIAQKGAELSASVEQSGSANNAIIEQRNRGISDEGYSADDSYGDLITRVTQQGDNNIADVKQVANYEEAYDNVTVSQNGSGNQATVEQHNSSRIEYNAANSISIDQDGINLVANATQYGNNNLIDAHQTGLANVAVVNQGTSLMGAQFDTTTIVQSGVANSVLVAQQ